MKRQFLWILGLVFILSSFLFSESLSFASEEGTEGDTFMITGTIMDSHKEPVKDARVKVLVNEKPQKVIVEDKWMEEAETSSHGTYQAAFKLPAGQINTASIQSKSINRAIVRRMWN